MIRELIHDPVFLALKSSAAGKEDEGIAIDLLDTLKSYKETCVGMAANMIGERKNIIAFLDESGAKPCYTLMYNPEIISKSAPYDTEEGCLSLLGGPRKCRRFKSVKVRFLNSDFQIRIKTYTGWTAQIIQHEVDHLGGVLI